MTFTQRERKKALRSGAAAPLVSPRSLLAGCVGGLAGGWTMSQFARLWNALSGSTLHSLPYSPEEWDAAGGTAEFVAKHLFGWSLSGREKGTGAAIVHYATGVAAGMLYASSVAPRIRRIRGSGALYGFTLWLIGKELLLPALGLRKKANRYTPGMQANAVGEHLVYGLTLDLLCRAIERSSH